MARMVGKASVCCVVTLGLLVLLTGCAEQGSQAILDLVPLQAKLVGEYGASNIIVELTGSTLGVKLACPSAGDPAQDRGVEQARRIAEFVCMNYGSMHLMDRVEVAFEIRQAGFKAGPAVSVTFPFEKGELDCGAG